MVIRAWMVSRAKLGSSAARLELSLLGGWDAHAAGRSSELPTRKTQALLASLALRPGHERDALRALLWPESTERLRRI